MANKTIFLRGKVYWAKIVGDPVDNYKKTGKEWTFEFEPDVDSLKILRENKLTSKLKDWKDREKKLRNAGEEEKADKLAKTNEGRGLNLILTQPTETRDGKKNDPIKIVDKHDQKWDGRKIGNGSVVDVKIRVSDFGDQIGMYPNAVRVVELVTYEAPEDADQNPGFPPIVEDADFKADFALDDDVPE